jgi:peptidyl-tRNA hydrolase
MIVFMSKQVIVIRRDLKLKRAEAASYVARSSMMFLLNNASFSDDPCTTISFSEEEKEWFDGDGKVIVLGVKSESALEEIIGRAEIAGLTVYSMSRPCSEEEKGRVSDTLICAAIGPHRDDDIDTITSKLKLF